MMALRRMKVGNLAFRALGPFCIKFLKKELKEEMKTKLLKKFQKSKIKLLKNKFNYMINKVIK